MITLMLFASGCSGNPGEKSPGTTKVQQINQEQKKIPNIQPDKAKLAVDIAKTVKGVDDASAVVIDKDLSLAVKVTNFQRFRLKNIRREVHHKLKKEFKPYEIHVTSDGKLFDELKKLEINISKKNINDPNQVKKKVDKINKDMRG